MRICDRKERCAVALRTDVLRGHLRSGVCSAAGSLRSGIIVTTAVISSLSPSKIFTQWFLYHSKEVCSDNFYSANGKKMFEGYIYSADMSRRYSLTHNTKKGESKSE